MKQRIIALAIWLAILIPAKIIFSADCCDCSTGSGANCHQSWTTTTISLHPFVNPQIPSTCHNGSLSVDDLTDYLAMNQQFVVKLEVVAGTCTWSSIYRYGTNNFSNSFGRFDIKVPTNNPYVVRVELWAPCECGSQAEGSGQRMIWKSNPNDNELQFPSQTMPGSAIRGQFYWSASGSPSTGVGCPEGW